MEEPNLPPKGHSKNGSKKQRSRPKEKTEEQKDDNVRQQQIRRMMKAEGIKIDRRKKVSEEDQHLIDDFKKRHDVYLNGPAPPRKKRKGVNDASVEEKPAKQMKAELVERDEEEQDDEVTNMPGNSGDSRLSTDPNHTRKSVRKSKSADRIPPLMENDDRGVNSSDKYSGGKQHKRSRTPPSAAKDKLRPTSSLAAVVD